jgi:periplasmic protein TonB
MRIERPSGSNPVPAFCAFPAMQATKRRWVMVLQHARSYPQSSRPHPNPTRIVGMAGAIALNVSLLMLLLVPMAGPMPVATTTDIPIRWILPAEKIPPPVRPPERVEVIRPRVQTPVARVQPDITPITPDPVIVEDGSLRADPVVEQVVATQPEIASGPLPGVRLQYARAPAPPYPRDALREGLQGVVMLQILVDTDGRPLEVSIQRSSGHRKLDEAARRFVLKHWTFQPAMKDGRAVQAIGIVPIDFDLGR